MKPSNALKENRELIHQVVSAHRASSPRVFGSVLHDRDREGSMKKGSGLYFCINSES